jgi:hypothetical protein
MNRNNVTIIGLTGRKRSGKDTVGKYMVDRGYIRVAFADALKNACREIFGFTDEQLNGDELKETVDNYWEHTPREILQTVGTELFRNTLPKFCNNINNDIWIRVVGKKINDLILQGQTKIVITDVRFENEYRFIKQQGGKIFKIIRPDNIRHNNSPHESEKLIDNMGCNKLITNNGTIADLYIKTEECLPRDINDEINDTNIL